MRKILFFLSALFITLPSLSQLPTDNKKEFYQRASSLCPEVAKLAEMIALARDIGHNMEWTSTIIDQKITHEKNELRFIQVIVKYVYSHPEMPPYEIFKKAQPICYQAFGLALPIAIDDSSPNI